MRRLYCGSASGTSCRAFCPGPFFVLWQHRVRKTDPQVDPVRPFSKGVHALAFSRSTSVLLQRAQQMQRMVWLQSFSPGHFRYLGIDRFVEETFQRVKHCVICRGACALQLFGHVLYRDCLRKSKECLMSDRSCLRKSKSKAALHDIPRYLSCQ